METWLPIVGYEDYSVSDLGRVRRETTRTSAVAGKIKAQNPDKDGYMMVCLSRPGDKQRTPRVHKLVWTAFRGSIPRGMTVNHEDGVKANNALSNLELMTHGDNIRHAIDVLGHDRRGAGNPAARLSESDVRTMRERRAAGELVRVLATDFGISKRMVSLITTGKSWANAPGPITEAVKGRPRKR